LCVRCSGVTGDSRHDLIERQAGYGVFLKFSVGDFMALRGFYQILRNAVIYGAGRSKQIDCFLGCLAGMAAG